jgi:hypothetical protein
MKYCYKKEGNMTERQAKTFPIPHCYQKNPNGLFKTGDYQCLKSADWGVAEIKKCEYNNNIVGKAGKETFPYKEIDMDILDRYSIQASFDTVRHLIDRKQVAMTEHNKANLERSIGFMDNVIKSLDSLGPDTPNNRQDCYYFTPNLKEIINIPPKKTSKISKESLKDSKEYFCHIKTNLLLLQQEPQTFYSSPEAENLKDIIIKFINIYSEDSYIVEKNITLAEGL